MKDKGEKIAFAAFLVGVLLISLIIGYCMAEKLENSRIGARIEYWLSEPNE